MIGTNNRKGIGLSSTSKTQQSQNHLLAATEKSYFTQLAPETESRDGWQMCQLWKSRRGKGIKAACIK